MRNSFTVLCLLVQSLVVGGAVAMEEDLSKMTPTPEMIREAQRNQNGWVYVIEGTFGPKDSVPPEAIAGAWKVDALGKIVPGSFQANPKYKPKN